MEFKIENTTVYGLERSIKASGNPMRTVIDSSNLTEKDQIRAKNLGCTRGGEGHDNFLKGIVVQFDLTAPLYFWKQAQRYHWFDFISSQSTMHCLLKFDVIKQCVPETNSEILKIMSRLIDSYLTLPDENPDKQEKWRELVASLPSGFCLGATMTTNYQQLKTMYNQRKHHKLKEWRIFSAWCEGLPNFRELVMKNEN